MNKFTILASAAVLAIASHQTMAQEDGPGCGVGSMVMDGKTGKGSHIIASFLNGFFTNTFSMTAGALGCDPTQVVQLEEAREMFVAENMDQLSTDTAHGDGDYLHALATLMGVPDSELPQFASLAQSQFDVLFQEGSDASSLISTLELAMVSDGRFSIHTVN